MEFMIAMLFIFILFPKAIGGSLVCGALIAWEDGKQKYAAHLAALAETPRVGLTICAYGAAGKPTAYRGAADLVMAVRKKIGAEAYDLHGLRYTTAAELAALGCSDELIASITGHSTMAMVAKYSSQTRQISRSREVARIRDRAAIDKQ